jgi:hypothetical protein
MRVVAAQGGYSIESASGGTDDLSDADLELAAGGKGGGSSGNSVTSNLINMRGGGVVACGGGNFRH